MIVRVDHHDDLGAALERFAVAGLLVAAVAEVALVDDDRESQLLGQRHGAVLRAVVDQDHLVDRAFRDVLDRLLKGLFRVVRGHHHDDFHRRSIAN